MTDDMFEEITAMLMRDDGNNISNDPFGIHDEIEASSEDTWPAAEQDSLHVMNNVQHPHRSPDNNTIITTTNLGSKSQQTSSSSNARSNGRNLPPVSATIGRNMHIQPSPFSQNGQENRFGAVSTCSSSTQSYQQQQHHYGSMNNNNARSRESFSQSNQAKYSPNLLSVPKNNASSISDVPHWSTQIATVMDTFKQINDIIESHQTFRSNVENNMTENEEFKKDVQNTFRQLKDQMLGVIGDLTEHKRKCEDTHRKLSEETFSIKDKNDSNSSILDEVLKRLQTLENQKQNISLSAAIVTTPHLEETIRKEDLLTQRKETVIVQSELTTLVEQESDKIVEETVKILEPESGNIGQQRPSKDVEPKPDNTTKQKPDKQVDHEPTKITKSSSQSKENNKRKTTISTDNTNTVKKAKSSEEEAYKKILIDFFTDKAPIKFGFSDSKNKGICANKLYFKRNKGKISSGDSGLVFRFNNRQDYDKAQKFYKLFTQNKPEQ